MPRSNIQIRSKDRRSEIGEPRPGSYKESLIFFQDSADVQKHIGLEEGLVCAVVGPGADEAGTVAVAVPVCNLFDGGLLEIVRQSGLAGSGGVARQNITGGILNPGSAECGVRSAEWRGKGNDTLAADQTELRS